MKSALLILVGLAVSGCSTVGADGRAGTHYYIGLVRVAYPEVRGNLTAVDVKSLGVGFDGAVFLGWRDNKLIYARPEDCRTVIVLRDRIELAHVERLAAVLGDKGCIVDMAAAPSH